MNNSYNDVNAVTLIGTLTGVPELKYTQNRSAFLKMRVAIHRQYRANDGSMKTSKTSLSVQMWGKRAEAFSQQVREGSRVMITGEITNRSWKDQQGNVNWSTEIKAEQAFCLDPMTPTGQYVQGNPSPYKQQPDPAMPYQQPYQPPQEVQSQPQPQPRQSQSINPNTGEMHYGGTPTPAPEHPNFTANSDDEFPF